ncbi:MAG: hypothetical protein CUN55_19440, partial [Phototrophicales bacterium]
FSLIADEEMLLQSAMLMAHSLAASLAIVTSMDVLSYYLRKSVNELIVKFLNQHGEESKHAIEYSLQYIASENIHRISELLRARAKAVVLGRIKARLKKEIAARKQYRERSTKFSSPYYDLSHMGNTYPHYVPSLLRP